MESDSDRHRPPGEAAGLLPTPAWRNRLYREGLTDRPWSAGDNINLSVGQGDIQMDPLQLANAYAAIGNGGRLLRPHVGMQVVDTAGRVVQEISPGARRQIPVDSAYRSAILAGLNDAAQSPGGTSYAVFGGFPVPVAGKTGTAERGIGEEDQSWYAVLAPYPNPRIVVAVTVERGRIRRRLRGPVALGILSEYFKAEAKPVGGGGGSSNEPDRSPRGAGAQYPSAAAPSIAERLGIPYMDPFCSSPGWPWALFSIFTLTDATLNDVPAIRTTSSNARASTSRSA